MAVVHTPESEYAKEMRKWEAYPTTFGPGQKPYRFVEFPKRLYRAEYVQGKGTVMADAQTAEDDRQEAALLSKGFHIGPAEAFAAIERQQTEFGKLAAEREWQIRHGRVGEHATEEVRAAEEAHGARHLPDVAQKPIKKRGRPVKQTVSA